ncbi:uncharacterized protein LOC106160923 [Lingula anatina]|uniref:Uncharacterized protein LOC106160923 n=1 Tax=Lingula anatina TaxID=7574 RepID=A0A1S3I4F7_LINAN|nr:uncharacterized protein LOC106160923 [Lingula anatina]|eukprot:XP_013393150.1 uncharacterized protein LOC106160923 [Lingula anatina]
MLIKKYFLTAAEFFKEYARREFAKNVEFDVEDKTLVCDRPSFSLVAQSEDQWQLPVLTPETPYIRPHLLCHNLRLTTAGAVGGTLTETDFAALCRRLVNKLRDGNPSFFTDAKFSNMGVVDKGFVTASTATATTKLFCFKKRGVWEDCRDQSRRQASSLNCRLFVKSIAAFME